MCIPMQIDDKVWVFNSRNEARKGGKLDYHWNGPYSILEQTTKGTYKLKNMLGKTLKQAISSIQMKPYVEDAENAADTNKQKKKLDASQVVQMN